MTTRSILYLQADELLATYAPQERLILLAAEYLVTIGMDASLCVLKTLRALSHAN